MTVRDAINRLKKENKINVSARATQLSTFDFAKLNHACLPIVEAFKVHQKEDSFTRTYLVGSALERPDYRDVDVRTILDDEYFDELFGGKMFFWSIFNLGITAYLRDVTGLPIDYQVQRMTEANEKYGAGKGTSRNPVGTKARPFAGGGDATGLIRTHDFESETKAGERMTTPSEVKRQIIEALETESSSWNDCKDPVIVSNIHEAFGNVIEIISSMEFPDEPEPLGEQCEDCDREYGANGLVWRATDDLWALVGWGERGLLCPDCFVKRLRALGVQPYFVAVNNETFLRLAEPPTDGDRETARKLNAEARQQPLGVDISDFGDEWCEGYLNGQDGVLTFIELVVNGTMATFQQAALVAPWLSYIASLGAAEPPSAPAPESEEA